MVTVKVGEFRDRVSQYIRRAENGETIVIVNRDREVAVLKPRHPHRTAGRGLLGCMKDSARIEGDITGPILNEADWFGG